MFVEITRKILAPIFSKFGYRLHPEAKICRQFVLKLAKMQTMGLTQPFVWAHIPNEFDGNVNHVFGRLMTAMGRIRGFPDYIFMYQGGCFAIEFKSRNGKLSEEQKRVGMWFRASGVKVYTCRSAEGGFKVLRKYGLLK